MDHQPGWILWLGGRRQVDVEGEVGHALASMRGTDVTDPTVGLDAALTALSGRIRLHEGGSSTPESVITDLWEAVLAQERPRDDDDSSSGKATAPDGATPASP